LGSRTKRPPITARARAAFCSSPGPPIAIGIMPTIIAAAVINTGRMRVCPAAIAASNAVLPANCERASEARGFRAAAARFRHPRVVYRRPRSGCMAA
jgi:hypothetical protein